MSGAGGTGGGPGPRAPLTVAVTGPTGTFGFGLLPLLEACDQVGRVVGIARRPFDPVAHGFTKLEYRQGDVRNFDTLVEAFTGADVVVHLAFLIAGNATRQQIRQVNVEGTLNVLRAAREASAGRFVYASSVAAYGFHPDNPVGMTEEWPTRPADRLFYAQEKAELEEMLRAELAGGDGSPIDLYLLRPPVVLGPHAVGGKLSVPAPVAGAVGGALQLMQRLPIPIPFLAADVPMQFIHEEDVGSALLACVLGKGPPGAYNIAGDGVVSGRELARELGLSPIAVPARVVHTLARAVSALPWPPFLPPSAEWVEALSHPAIMDTGKARRELGWTPRHTALDAVRETLAAARRS